MLVGRVNWQICLSQMNANSNNGLQQEVLHKYGEWSACSAGDAGDDGVVRPHDRGSSFVFFDPRTALPTATTTALSTLTNWIVPK